MYNIYIFIIRVTVATKLDQQLSWQRYAISEASHQNPPGESILCLEYVFLNTEQENIHYVRCNWYCLATGAGRSLTTKTSGPPSGQKEAFKGVCYLYR